MRTVRVQPEQRGHPGITSPGDGQLHPVANRCILDDAHAPDVARLHVLAQQHLTGCQIHEVGDAVLGNLEGFVVRAVLLSLLCHEPDIGHGAHRRRIEGAVCLTEIDHLLVDPGERGLRVDRLGVLELAVGTVHLAAGADHGRHRRVHDHVGRRMEVRDSPGRVHHGQLGTVFVAGVQVLDDLVAFRRGQRLDLVVEIN